MSFSTIYRNYLWNFYALESNAFSEQSNVRNEKGFYAALQMDINSNWQWSCYADMYHFPKSSYYSNSPIRGRDYLVQLNYRLDKFYNSYLRIKNENKTIEVYHDVGLKKIENLYQYSIQFQNQYSISDFVFKNRLVWNTFQNEMGYLLFQDLAYRPLNKKWSFSLRYVLFDTPSYSSRIYAYEPDVLYSFSVPIHYGEGQKYVAILSYKMKSKLTINFKYAQTQYFDQTPIRGGSIEGQLFSEFKILLKQVF